MFKKLLIKNNYYKDSITLMAITNKVNALEGVNESAIGMATAMNKEIIRSIGFASNELHSIKPSDMMIALKLESEAFLESALASIEDFLVVKEEVDGTRAYSNSKQAIAENPHLNMAVISIPGNYAYIEAKRCLDNNINVMLFSDNMPIEDEVKLKQLAVSKNLLMMGPDCGTSIINGVGLCFANKIKKGNIGIVGASGTGIQEATVLIDKCGSGVSHALGTGGHDLSKEVGGLMMLQGMDMLENDSQTDIILLISKPPATEIALKILDKVKKSQKKYVVCFINGDKNLVEESGAAFASTLEEAGYMAAGISQGKAITPDLLHEAVIAKKAAARLSKEQKYLRGLYCGGTLAAETEMIFGRDHKIHSNISKIKERKLDDPFVSKENTIIDLGDDVFTQGKPHPMIDPSIRNSRILKEAQDQNVGVMILDFELGYGSNDNPIGLTADSLKKAKEIAKNGGRELIIICYLLFTEQDKQNIKEQHRLLASLDVILTKSNAEAARIASRILKEVNG